MKIVTTSDGGDIEVTIKIWTENIIRSGNRVDATTYVTVRPTSDWGSTEKVWYGFDGNTWISESVENKYEISSSITQSYTVNDQDSWINYDFFVSWNPNHSNYKVKITENFLIPSNIYQQLYTPDFGYGRYMDNDGWIHCQASTTGAYTNTNFGGKLNNRIQANTDYSVIVEIDSIQSASLTIGALPGNSDTGQIVPINTRVTLSENGSYLIPCSSNNRSNPNKLVTLTVKGLEDGNTPAIKFRISVIEDTSITLTNFVYENYIDTNTVVKKVKSAFGNEAKIGTEAQYVFIGNNHSLQYWLDNNPSILGGIAAPTSDIGKSGDIYIEYEGIE